MTVDKPPALRPPAARLTLAAATSIALTFGLTAPAQAVPEQSTGVETNHPASALIGQKVSFDYASAEEGLKELRKLRAEMWDANPAIKVRVMENDYPREKAGKLQDVSAEAGLKTKDEYVNAAQLDGGYVQMALQLSAEVPNGSGTLRPFNSQCELQEMGAAASSCKEVDTASVSGVSTDGVITQFSNSQAPFEFFKSAPLGQKIALLNPFNTRYGFSSTLVEYSPTVRRHVTAVTFGPDKTTIDFAPFKTGKRDVIIYRAVRSKSLGSGSDDETPTGFDPSKKFDPTKPPHDVADNPEPNPNPKPTDPDRGSGEGSSKDLKPGEIAGIVIGVLTLLGIGNWVVQNWPMIARMLNLPH